MHDTEIVATVGARIRDRRRALNVSAAAFAAYLGVSEGTVNAYETGFREPNLTALTRIAQGLDTTVGCLLAEHPFDPKAPDDEHESDLELVIEALRLSARDTKAIGAIDLSEQIRCAAIADRLAEAR